MKTAHAFVTVCSAALFAIVSPSSSNVFQIRAAAAQEQSAADMKRDAQEYERLNDYGLAGQSYADAYVKSRKKDTEARDKASEMARKCEEEDMLASAGLIYFKLDNPAKVRELADKLRAKGNDRAASVLYRKLKIDPETLPPLQDTEPVLPAAPRAEPARAAPLPAEAGAGAIQAGAKKEMTEQERVEELRKGLGEAKEGERNGKWSFAAYKYMYAYKLSRDEKQKAELDGKVREMVNRIMEQTEGEYLYSVGNIYSALYKLTNAPDLPNKIDAARKLDQLNSVFAHIQTDMPKDHPERSTKIQGNSGELDLVSDIMSHFRNAQYVKTEVDPQKPYNSPATVKAIKELQVFLGLQGYTVSVNGLFDAATRDAVLAFAKAEQPKLLAVLKGVAVTAQEVTAGQGVAAPPVARAQEKPVTFDSLMAEAAALEQKDPVGAFNKLSVEAWPLTENEEQKIAVRNRIVTIADRLAGEGNFSTATEFYEYADYIGDGNVSTKLMLTKQLAALQAAKDGLEKLKRNPNDYDTVMEIMTALYMGGIPQKFVDINPDSNLAGSIEWLQRERLDFEDQGITPTGTMGPKTRKLLAEEIDRLEQPLIQDLNAALMQGGGLVDLGEAKTRPAAEQAPAPEPVVSPPRALEPAQRAEVEGAVRAAAEAQAPELPSVAEPPVAEPPSVARYFPFTPTSVVAATDGNPHLMFALGGDFRSLRLSMPAITARQDSSIEQGGAHGVYLFESGFGLGAEWQNTRAKLAFPLNGGEYEWLSLRNSFGLMLRYAGRSAGGHTLALQAVPGVTNVQVGTNEICDPATGAVCKTSFYAFDMGLQGIYSTPGELFTALVAGRVNNPYDQVRVALEGRVPFSFVSGQPTLVEVTGATHRLVLQEDETGVTGEPNARRYHGAVELRLPIVGWSPNGYVGALGRGGLEVIDPQTYNTSRYVSADAGGFLELGPVQVVLHYKWHLLEDQRGLFLSLGMLFGGPTAEKQGDGNGRFLGAGVAEWARLNAVDFPGSLTPENAVVRLGATR